MSRVTEGKELRSGPHLAGIRLTIVERRIIALTANGSTLTEISLELGITERTVRRMRFRMYEKLGAKNAANAVAIWLGREALEIVIRRSLPRKSK